MIKSIDRFFGVTKSGSTISRELIGGLVTFFAMAYILAVHPGIMSAAGMPFANMVTSTAIAAGVSTLIMAFLGKLPIGTAPGLGINAFIAFTVCGSMGFGWGTAILAVFAEGVIFIILSLVRVREKIINAIPDTLKKAVTLGIGLFIAVVGLTNAGLVGHEIFKASGTTLALAPITGGTPLLAIIGLAITIILYITKVPGSIFLSIIITTIIGIPMGITKIPDFSVWSIAPPLMPADVFANLGSSFHPVAFISVLISLLFVDMFDTVSTLFGVAQQGNLIEDGKVKNVKNALLSDAIGTCFGAVFGATTVTSYVESSIGVGAGARTGLASVSTGLLFLISIFLGPLFAVIPSAATAPALIFVACLMISAISNVDFHDLEISIPTTITIIAIPFSYSISMGLSWGFCTYALTKVCAGKYKEITIPMWILTAIFFTHMIGIF